MDKITKMFSPKQFDSEGAEAATVSQRDTASVVTTNLSLVRPMLLTDKTGISNMLQRNLGAEARDNGSERPVSPPKIIWPEGSELTANSRGHVYLVAEAVKDGNHYAKSKDDGDHAREEFILSSSVPSGEIVGIAMLLHYREEASRYHRTAELSFLLASHLPSDDKNSVTKALAHECVHVCEEKSLHWCTIITEVDFREHRPILQR